MGIGKSIQLVSMALREVKKELNAMEKAEIIKLVSEMYKNIPDLKVYLDIFATGEIEESAAKYKKQIEKFVYPSGRNGILREAEARKLIRSVEKMKITRLNVELQLFYVSCCLEVIRDFGFWDEGYYMAVDNMFYQALHGINELGILVAYENQLNKICTIGSEFGFEFYY